jgi:hypothetical protein
MASSAWSEPVAVVREARFIVRFQEGAYDFLQYLV